eukprot:gene10319-biopygen232
MLILKKSFLKDPVVSGLAQSPPKQDAQRLEGVQRRGGDDALGVLGEAATPASGPRPRPVRVRSFAAIVRLASGPRPLPFRPACRCRVPPAPRCAIPRPQKWGRGAHGARSPGGLSRFARENREERSFGREDSAP